jgi:hypothetical protein
VGSFGGRTCLTEIRINPPHRFRLKRAFISTPPTKPLPTLVPVHGRRSHPFGRSEQATWRRTSEGARRGLQISGSAAVAALIYNVDQAPARGRAFSLWYTVFSPKPLRRLALFVTRRPSPAFGEKASVMDPVLRNWNCRNCGRSNKTEVAANGTVKCAFCTDVMWIQPSRMRGGETAGQLYRPVQRTP